MSPELETPASLVEVPAMDGTSPMLLELEDIQHFLLVRPRALAARYGFLSFHDPAQARRYVDNVADYVGTGSQVAGAFDHGLRQPVAVAEVVVRELVGRRRFEVERGKHLHARKGRDPPLMLQHAPLAFRGVACEQDHDRVQVGAGESIHPVVRVVGAGVAQNFGARGHALPELLRERRQGRFVEPEFAQAVPGESDRDPA